MARKKHKSADGCGTLFCGFMIIGVIASIVEFFKTQPLVGSIITVLIVMVVLAIIIVANHGTVTKSIVHTTSKKNVKPRIAYDSSIDHMSGYEFESWCASLLKKNGFKKITVTRGSGDQGVDIIAWRGDDKYAVQCKRYNQSVGNRSVQEVFTGSAIYGCNRAIVITNNYFTPGAIRAAHATGVELWDRDFINRIR